jgi:hypothetical protein
MPGFGSGAKQHVDGWPMAVLPRADAQPGDVVFDDQVVVGRRDYDRAVVQRSAVLCRPARQMPCPAQDVRKRARAGRRDVKYDAKRCGQIRREAAHHVLERLNAARRRPDHDELAPGRRFWIGG